MTQKNHPSHSRTGKLHFRSYFDCGQEDCDTYKFQQELAFSITAPLRETHIHEVDEIKPQCIECEHLTRFREENPKASFDYISAIMDLYTQRVQHTLKEGRNNLNVLMDIIETSPDMLIATDMDMSVTLCNRATETLTGYDRNEILGKSIFLLFEEHEVRKMVEILSEDGDFRAYRTRICCSDGRFKPLEMSAAIITDNKGDPIYTVGASREIT